MEIDNKTKEQIAADLRKYVDNMAGGSANKASKLLKGISNAYVSMMLSGKWGSIGDAAWRNIQKQVSGIGAEWIAVNTKATDMLNFLLTDAKAHALTLAIIGDAGTGKTFTAKRYAAENENVFLVCCNEYFNRKTFLAELLQAMGKDGGGYTVSEMMQTVVSTARKLDKVLIILDEADKLTDQVLYFFISLYNLLEGKAALVLMATDHLQKRIDKGVNLNKKGYKEIFSRIGRKFIPLPKPTKADQLGIINANGIQDELKASEIINQSEGDLRRVERLVHSNKRKAA
ncbi:ATP-binding protein [Olivibacter sp. 47]|uniref:ATP-binding protein n=1 Tax=Olivibacter sp. 47 TaxID=3056486 RepID=UPI0025A3949E|nr:ATP-binding protein [Olivibacter sp. 47]MDM8176872.1 ATP-binding protein [Olivibacter sp. 47]